MRQPVVISIHCLPAALPLLADWQQLAASRRTAANFHSLSAKKKGRAKTAVDPTDGD
jgi:hypothetical protein